MDSLPPQPIDGLPIPDRKEALAKIGRLCVARRDFKDPSDEELANLAGFNSEEIMRISLQNWGLSSLLPPPQEDQPKQQREYKPGVSKGTPVELPPPENARRLFESTKRMIDGDLLFLSSLSETLQDGRFMGELGGGELGGNWFPHHTLVRLIGAHIAASGCSPAALERLTEALHPHPTEANRKRLDRYVWGVDRDTGRYRGEGFMERLCQVAALVRGLPEVKRGAKPPSIAPDEQHRQKKLPEEF
jgi:hypothetical protein